MTSLYIIQYNSISSLLTNLHQKLFKLLIFILLHFKLLIINNQRVDKETEEKILSKILPFAPTWMELEGTMPSQVSPSKKDKYHLILLIYGI